MHLEAVAFGVTIEADLTNGRLSFHADILAETPTTAPVRAQAWRHQGLGSVAVTAETGMVSLVGCSSDLYLPTMSLIRGH